MKVVILCGGKGTRLGNTEGEIPKPLVKIGKVPILKHVMTCFARDGFTDFILLTGYKHELIENWILTPDIPRTWSVQTLFTGDATQTGGRVFRAVQALGNNAFFLTYGDGLSNVNTVSLLEFHWIHGRIATITAVHPPPRFGQMELDETKTEVINFSEKPLQNNWINGGFMVLEGGALKGYYEGHSNTDIINLEKDILPELAKDSQVSAFCHSGYWQCMDTPRDVEELRETLEKGKIWLRRVHSGNGNGF